MASQESFSVTLTKDEVLILLELLSDFRDQPGVLVRDRAERRALWNLTCLLEKALPDVFSPGYEELIKMARKNLCY